MDEAPKHTLTDVNTLANGETAKEMDRARCRGPMDRSTWVNSRTTYKAGKARSCGPTDRNMLVNSRTISQMDKARYSFPGGAIYVGEIKDGLYNGQGTYTSAE